MITRGISPKAIAATAMAVITYILGQQLLELPATAVLVAQALLVALGAIIAKPGTVECNADDLSDHPQNHEAGYALVELAIGLVIFAIAVLLLLKVIDHI